MDAASGFAVATALHAGFQLTVTALVYPALASHTDAEWRAAHDRHSRVITPLVGVVYLALLGTGGWLLAAGPSALGWVALAATAAAVLVTAAVAGPAHGRLTDRDAELVERLLVADRVRCGFAVVGAVAATLALLV